jgi:hypothetical protein
MACQNIQGIIKGCDNSIGGINAVWLIDQDSVTATTVDLTAHTVTAIATNGDLFQGFEFKRNVGNFIGTPTIDLINGSTFYSYTLTLMFHKREATKSYSLQLLGEGQRYLNAIVRDNLGKYWYLTDLQLNGGDETTGTLKSDMNGYTVTFLGEILNRAYEITAGIVPALLA